MFDSSLSIQVKTPCPMTLSEVAAMFDVPYVRCMLDNKNFYGNTFLQPPVLNDQSPMVQINDPLLFIIDDVHFNIRGDITADIRIDSVKWAHYMTWNICGLTRVIGERLSRRFTLVTIDAIITPPKT